MLPMKSGLYTRHRTSKPNRRTLRTRYRISRKANRGRLMNHLRRRILDATTLGNRTTPDGIYAWIISEPDRKLYAARVWTAQEIGTTHVNLLILTGSSDVFAAGEFKKDGMSVFYNFKSGSFMSRKSEKELNDLKAPVETAFLEASVLPRFDEGPSFITDKIITRPHNMNSIRNYFSGTNRTNSNNDSNSNRNSTASSWSLPSGEL